AVLIAVVGAGVVEPTHRPTRTVSVFSTVVSGDAIVTVARLTLSFTNPDGLAVRTRSPPAVPLGVTVSHGWFELAVQLVARPRLSRTRTLLTSFESPGVLANATPLPSTSSLWDSRLNVTGRLFDTVSPLTCTVKLTDPLYVPPTSPLASGVSVTINGVEDILPEDSERCTKELAVEFHGNALTPVFRLSCSGTPLKSRPLLPPSVTPAGVTESVALLSLSATLMALV